MSLNNPRRSLADRLALLAAERLRRRYPDWADAMLSEQASLADGRGRLGWALGALRASFLVQPPDLPYPALLLLAVFAMTLYQWRVDEGPITLLAVAALSLCLGLLRPSCFLISGLAVGVVVTAVNGFETFSGIRPAYETHAHTVVHDLRWLVLVLPALVASVIGRQVGSALIANAKSL